MEHAVKIAEFIFGSFLHIWPYLVITIPAAVFVKLSGASKYIGAALGKKPVVSIFLATAVGAFSPLCSCSVIPVIASLLMGGVPLAPVMSFWLASPSMDPEVFFLSTAAIGWDLSVWRLVATFTISLLSGFITHLLVKKGRLGENALRENASAANGRSINSAFRKVWAGAKAFIVKENTNRKVQVQFITGSRVKNSSTVSCCVPAEELSFRPEVKTGPRQQAACSSTACGAPTVPFRKRVLEETGKATAMVVKFMLLAFFINALIRFYVPQESISGLLGGDGFFTVVVAALTGIPFYTSSIAALPLVGGLLEMGMSEGAALAFLISGPVTTLPAMAAVWGLVRRKVFVLYLSFALTGSLLFGMLVNFFNLLL